MSGKSSPDPGLEALSEATGAGHTAPDDAYEAMMADGDTVLHRQKMVWPWYFYALLILVTLFGVAGSFAGALASGGLLAFLPPLLMMGVMALVWSMFHSLRVTVTPEKASIKYGLIGPSIPIDKITHCEPEAYSVFKYGGYGVRFGVDGTWAFNMLGDKGKAVRIHYTTKIGTNRKIVVSALHPHVLADAINRARAAKGHDVPLDSGLSDAELGLDSDEILFEEKLAIPEKVEQEQEVVEEEETAARR